MRFLHSATLALSILLTCMIPFGGGSGLAAAAEFQTVQIGFGGVGRVGNALPISVEATSLPPSCSVVLNVTAADPRGNLLTDTVAAGTSDNDGRVLLQGVFRVGRLNGTCRLTLADAASGELFAERTIVVEERQRTSTGSNSRLAPASSPPGTEDRLALVRHAAQCLLTVGSIAGVPEMESLVQNAFGNDVRLAVLNVPTLRELPVTREGLDSVDLLLLLDNFDVSAEQAAAIREWVLTGGHLMVSCAAKVESLLTSPLGQWLQPHFEIHSSPVSIRELSSVQNFVSGAVQLQTLSRPVPMARLNSDQIRVIVDSLEGPVIARRAIGGGTVTFIAIDLNQRPLNSWKSLDKFYSMLVFDRPVEGAAQGSRRGTRISSSGVSDLSTQLASVYDAIPAAQRWSSWQIMALIAVYLLVIGPLDYLLVVHFLKMPHLTWVTFPVMVAAGCGFVYWQFDSGTPEFTERQMHVLDISEADGRQVLFARSWTSISSVDTRRTDIEAVPRSLFQQTDQPASVLQWSGRAEDVYGGMYREVGAGLGQQTYQRIPKAESTDSKLLGVPLLAGGSQSFCFESLNSLEGNPWFESKLSVSGTGLLEGDVITRLPVPIDRWIVFFGSRVYQPVPDATPEQRSIQPGQVWNRRNGFVRASDLKSYLNGTRIIASPKNTAKGGVKGDSMQVTTPYNPRGTDPMDILTMVSLYDTAGGEVYVGLNNDALRRMELSSSIRMNYALLIGMIDQPLADFLLDGQTAAPTESATIVRILLPVVRQQSQPPASVKPEAEAPAVGSGDLPAADTAAPAPDVQNSAESKSSND